MEWHALELWPEQGTGRIQILAPRTSAVRYRRGGESTSQPQEDLRRLRLELGQPCERSALEGSMQIG
jgi:hypothetical protein